MVIGDGHSAETQMGNSTFVVYVKLSFKKTVRNDDHDVTCEQNYQTETGAMKTEPTQRSSKAAKQ